MIYWILREEFSRAVKIKRAGSVMIPLAFRFTYTLKCGIFCPLCRRPLLTVEARSKPTIYENKQIIQ